MTSTHDLVSNPRATILIIDDDMDLLKLCAVKLQAQGFAVLTALGSTEAHRLCADHPGKIELILIDVMSIRPKLRSTAITILYLACMGINCSRCCAPNALSLV